jgi:hypothetical protein
MSKLLELLQPKEYKSKIKLFCREKKVETEITIKKFCQSKDIHYISQIIITEKK